MATATATSLSKLESILGNDAASLLQHECKTIPKSQLHLPGPDFITRIFSTSDRPRRKLGPRLPRLGRGRLAGTGYLSILPVDQGIEHSDRCKLGIPRGFGKRQKSLELAIEGGCNAVA